MFITIVRGGIMFRKFLVPIVAISLLLVFACDKDSTSSTTVDQSVTVSLNGGTIVTYENPNSMQAAYLVTGVEPVADSTFYIVAADGSTSSIFITFKGAAAGTYDVAALQGMGDGSNNFDIVYVKSVTEMYGISISGSVIVTAFGAVGELVEGTYDAFVAVWSDGQPTADSARVSGSFSVERAADGTSLD